MKKVLFALVSLVIGHSAMASIGPNSSWEEIMAARGPYKIAAPTVYMGRSIDYTFVCRDGDRLRTMKPVDIVETRGTNHRTELVVTGHEYLSTPIHYSLTQDFCDETHHRTECKPFTTTGDYPMTVNIKIYKVSLKEGIERFWFSKSYTVPDCETPQPN